MPVRTLSKVTAAVLLAMLALTACTDTGNGVETTAPPETSGPVETPDPSSEVETETSAPETETSPPETETPDERPGYPERTGTPPLPPESFGDFTATDAPSTNGTMYATAGDEQIITVSHSMYLSAEEEAETIDDATTIGNWYCGTIDQGAKCATNAWDGTTRLLSITHSPEELADLGDQLMEAWQ